MDGSHANTLANVVRQLAYEIHVFHAHGYPEKIYENALVNRLRKRGLHVEQQVPIRVFDEDGTVLGMFTADLLVEDILLIEIKAVQRILTEHTAQLLGYLKSSRLRHGVLINFGSQRFEMRKFVSPFA